MGTSRNLSEYPTYMLSVSTLVLAGAMSRKQTVKLPAAEVDPLLLNVRRSDKMSVSTNNWFDLNDGKLSSLGAFVKKADKYNFVFLGESHDDPVHHQTQANVIDGLVKHGRTVIVGLEMFTRPNQENLNAWTLGKESEDEFIKNSNWQKEWGFPFPLYRPIFNVIKANRLPMIALNVPRDWVRSVGKNGLKGLTAEQQAQVPTVLTNNANHKAVFNGLMGGHPMVGTQGDNIYAAQCLWDEGMADTALKYVTNRFGSPSTIPKNVVFVIVAGMGHGLYKQGINWRIMRRTGLETLTLINVESEQPMPISRGVADYVYIAPVFARK
jgi:uncharacterized iron-regulated protein